MYDSMYTKSKYNSLSLKEQAIKMRYDAQVKCLQREDCSFISMDRKELSFFFCKNDSNIIGSDGSDVFVKPGIASSNFLILNYAYNVYFFTHSLNQ